jgi:hypothetical protein
MRDTRPWGTRKACCSGLTLAEWLCRTADRSIRRECLNHVIVGGEAHLRRFPRSYAMYCNKIRTHQSLDKDAPIWRPIQQTGAITSNPILGGLHHHYIRI